MKTTVEIPNHLFEEVRRLAAAEHVTLKSLMIEGLRKVVDERHACGTFHLRRATFAGRGLRPELRSTGWSRLRDLAYDGRGA